MSSSQTPTPAPLAVDRREAARLLGISAGSVDNLRLRGELASVKLLGRRLFAVADLANLLASKREGVPE